MSEFYTKVWEHDGYHLVTRPDTPNYYIYWRPPKGRMRRISTGLTDRAAAERRLIEHAESRRVPKKRSPHEVPLAEALQGYMTQRLNGKARKDAVSVARCFLAFMEAEAISVIAEMTTAMQKKYIEWRRKNSVGRKAANGELSNGTINKDLETLRAALRFWQQEGHVAEVPHVRLLKKPPARDRFLTPEEVQRLLDCCVDQHLYVFVMLALHTLQRPGAIFDLRCEQVHLERGLIDFNPPGRPQSSKRRPVVPITETLRPVLERAIADSVTGHVVEYLAAPVRKLRRSFATACANACLKNVSPYTLRHTGATLLAAVGVPLWQISGMLGHSLTRTTEIYAKHAPGFLGDASDGLDQVYRPASLEVHPEQEGIGQSSSSTHGS